MEKKRKTAEESLYVGLGPWAKFEACRKALEYTCRKGISINDLARMAIDFVGGNSDFHDYVEKQCRRGEDI